jgi:hypothetical protein
VVMNRRCLAALALSFLTINLAGAQDLPTEMEAPIAREPAAGREASELPAEEVQCRADLARLGASFTALPTIEDEDGCGIDHPIELSSLGNDVSIEPPIALACRTGLATGRLARAASRVADARFGSRLASLRQVSGYVCRPRSGGGQLSEHAVGNAIDISAFVLADGNEVVVRPYGRAHEQRARFMESVRDEACGIFTTVLGPATDTDHIDHLHLDVAERSAPFCR